MKKKKIDNKKKSQNGEKRRKVKLARQYTGREKKDNIFIC